MDWLLDLLGLNKGKATIDAANQNKNVLGELGIDLNGIIDTTDAAQKGYLNEARDLIGLGDNGAGIIRDALGLGGDEGKTRALDAFKGTDPGFDFRLNTGLDALDRRAASRGMLNSGNTSIDTLNYADGLASQGWGDWLDRLTGASDREVSLLGDMATQAGGTGATRLGVTTDLASGEMGANNQVAAGREAGQGAIWDLLGNVAGVAGSAFGLNGGGFGKGPSAAGGGKLGRLGYGGGF